MNNYIGLNIKYLCSEKKLSQKEFGDIFDIKQGTISGYIVGRTEPNIAFLQNVSIHFGITIDDFINSNLEEKKYKTQDVFSGNVSEPPVEVHSTTSQIVVEAQAKTISVLEKHNATLEKQVLILEKTIENLQEKSKAS